MKDTVKSLFKLENIPLTLAFFTSFGFLLFDLILNPDPSILFKIILFVLGVISFGMLAERLGYFERIEKTLGEIRRSEEPFLRIPVGWTDFEKYSDEAREIFVSGGSLAQLVPRYCNFFLKKAESGCKLRFILIDPASPAIESIAKWKGSTSKIFKNEIELSLEYLRKLIRTNLDVEVRLNNSTSALTVMIFDASRPSGRIRVDLQLYQCSPEKRPFFELTHSQFYKQKENLYQNFLEQYSRLWDESIIFS
ncbi:MAG: DUF5919 domain-containing protein [Candidatus Zhuqueibacterota bacterium]